MFSKQDLRRLIIPLILEQVLAITVGVADTMMVSSSGEAAVSGIALVDTINIMLIALFTALATGGAVVSAQYIGQKDEKRACLAANQLLLITFIVSVAIMIISLVGNRGLLGVLYGKAEVEVMVNARIYFYVSAVSYPFLAVYNACAALCRSMGNSKVSLYSSIVMNVLNIGGNAIFLFVFRWGVFGVALSSLISRIVAAAIMIFVTRNQKAPIHIDLKLRLGYKPCIIKKILLIGIPNGLENSIFHIGKIFVQSLIVGFGTVSVTANAIASNVSTIELLPGTAIGLAMITIVGQCVGAGKLEEAKLYTKKLMKLSYVIIISVSILVVIFNKPIMMLYNLSPETEEITQWLIIYHAIAVSLVWPISFVTPNALRAANDVKYTMVIAITSMWVFRIGLSYILGLGFGLGVQGVWIAMTIDWLFRGIVFTKRFLSNKWLEIHMPIDTTAGGKAV